MGYLSPSTCAVLYAVQFRSGMALSRGSSGCSYPAGAAAGCGQRFLLCHHDVQCSASRSGLPGTRWGLGAAAVVLGPWASMLSVSIALLIQALFFGDGGITTLGANCFNMAIAGSLVAHLVYRAIAGKSAIPSSRRVVAAALAGYAAINVSALLTACELGIQPLFFKDASGTPLYAPYALHIAIPAMMLGHLTFAGMAELFVSGGVVAYLQKTNPALLGQKPSANEAQAAFSYRRGMEDHSPALDSRGPFNASNAYRNSRCRHSLGRMGSERFLRSADATADCGGLGQRRSSVRTAWGLARLSSLWAAPFPQYAPPSCATLRLDT